MKLAPVLQTRSAAVVRTAIASRTLVCLVVALSSFVAPAYDDSRSVSDTASSPTSRPDAASDTAPAQLSRGDVLVNNVIGPLANWDGVYFLTIAQHGYQFEQYYAFFPLLPLLMRAARYVRASADVENTWRVGDVRATVHRGVCVRVW